MVKPRNEKRKFLEQFFTASQKTLYLPGN